MIFPERRTNKYARTSILGPSIARLEGDEWVINEQKAWASNSGASDACCVLCTTDPEAGDSGIALIYVPESCKGFDLVILKTKPACRGIKTP